MCGIAGYVGPKEAQSILLVALERLKYRGYDSAGLAILADGDIHVRKAAGRLRSLEEMVDLLPIAGTCGIAHTRWATHGVPSEENAHPHLDGGGSVAVVHNGIIENHEALHRELEEQGAVFVSQTDTEVIPHLLAGQRRGDPVQALLATVARLEGSFAFAALFADRPQCIYAARKGSPLMVGRGHGQLLLASDVPALLPHASEVAIIEDGWIVEIAASGVRAWNFAGQEVALCFTPLVLKVADVTKGDHESFMAKEIAEQPEVLERLLDSRLRSGALVHPDLGLDLSTVNHVLFLACGTSWHAALLGKRFLEQIARIHVEVDISSEYRYRNPVAAGGTLVVAISQSGETADTLAGLRLAKAKFMPAISLVNVVESTIARESDSVMPLMAGPEIGVASTKAYTAQVLALYIFALQMARAHRRLSPQDTQRAIDVCRRLPALVAETLALCRKPVEEAADLLCAAPATVFLGRGGEHPTALEGALKLKEIAYVHATGYPAGEFKHGPIALVTPKLPVVCCCPRDEMFDKMLSNLQEVRARKGRIIAVGAARDQQLQDLADHLFPICGSEEPLLLPLCTILPLQRYAYAVARRRDCDVDQPRNLAKSVTVE